MGASFQDIVKVRMESSNKQKTAPTHLETYSISCIVRSAVNNYNTQWACPIKESLDALWRCALSRLCVLLR